MAGNGLDLFAKYRIYLVDSDLAGPEPGSRVLPSHTDSFYDFDTESWIPSRLDFTASSLKRAYSKTAPLMGSESMPQIRGHRFKTAEPNGFEIGDNVLISMLDVAGQGADAFAFNTAYSTGDYVTYKDPAKSNNKPNRCIAPDTSGGSEENWNSIITRQSGGVPFIGEANANSSLNPPVTLYPWKIAAYDLIEGTFVVEVPFDPEKSGGGQGGWVFNTNIDTVADIGPEDCLFARSKPLSISLLDDSGNPTIQPYYYTTADLRRAIRLWWSGGLKFNRMTTNAVSSKFAVVAMVAEHYEDDDLPYEEQVPIYVVRNNVSTGMYTDADLIADPVTGEIDYLDVSQISIVMGIN